MVKWLKRILLVVCVVFAGAMAFSAWGYWRVRTTPDWYKKFAGTPEQREAAAARAEDKFIAAQNWVAAARAREQAVAGGKVPATNPAGERPFSVSFTAEELNAFFHKWDKVYGWEQKYGKYLEDPAVFVNEGRLILAATVKDFGSVVSFHFEPKLTPDGKLDLDLERVLAGKLPMPEAAWAGQKEKVAESLRERLPAWQRAAKVDASGAPNQALINAAMTKLMLHALNHEPGAPVLFLPQVRGASLPVKVAGVKVGDDGVSLTVEPLDAKERATLLEKVKEPVKPEVAAGGRQDLPSRGQELR